MNRMEMYRAPRQLRLNSIAAATEKRLQQAQVENMALIDLISVVLNLIEQLEPSLDLAD